jgi:hypothetical protein
LVQHDAEGEVGGVESQIYEVVVELLDAGLVLDGWIRLAATGPSVGSSSAAPCTW